MLTENMNYIETVYCNIVLDQRTSKDGVCSYAIFLEFPNLAIDDETYQVYYDYDIARKEFFKLAREYKR